MSIKFTCKECGHKLKAGDGQAGKRVRCTQCRGVAIVPAPVARGRNARPEIASPAGDGPENSGEGEDAAAAFLLGPRTPRQADARPSWKTLAADSDLANNAAMEIPSGPKPRNLPPSNAPARPRFNRYRSPLFMGGVAAALCAVAGIIFLATLPGKNRTQAKTEIAAQTPPEQKVEAKPENPKGQNEAIRTKELQEPKKVEQPAVSKGAKENGLTVAEIVGTWDGPVFSLVIEPDGKGRATAVSGNGTQFNVFIAYYTIDTSKGAPQFAFEFTAARNEKGEIPSFDLIVLSRPTTDALVVKETKDRIKPNPVTLIRRKTPAGENQTGEKKGAGADLRKKGPDAGLTFSVIVRDRTLNFREF
jgi:hypothetical protein